MPTYDASNAQCHVYTLKEGMLAAIAHDLKIEVTRFSIDVSDDGLSIKAEFDPSSLRVVCAVVGGSESRSTLSAGDRSKIERSIMKDVLHVRRYPEIRFSADDVSEGADGPVIGGELELHGRRQHIEAFGRQGDTGLEVTLSINQPDFGIKPYRAMMGTLRVQPRVKVHLTVPRE